MIHKLINWTKTKPESEPPVKTKSLLVSTNELKTEVEELVEKLRLQRLREINIIQTKLDDDLRDFVLIASAVCGTKVAAIDLVDSAKVWIKAKVGDDNIPSIVDRSDSICHYTIKHNDVTVIPDTLLDDRVKDLIYVRDKSVRFYAGAPLLTPDGFAIGAICVWDSDYPRDLSKTQREVLAALGRLAGSLLVKLK